MLRKEIVLSHESIANTSESVYLTNSLSARYTVVHRQPKVWYGFPAQRAYAVGVRTFFAAVTSGRSASDGGTTCQN